MREFFHYFFGKGETVEFRDFSLAHFVPILLMIAVILLIWRYRHALQNSKHESRIRMVLAFAMIISAALPKTTGKRILVNSYPFITGGKELTASHDGFMLSPPNGSKPLIKSLFIIALFSFLLHIILPRQADLVNSVNFKKLGLLHKDLPAYRCFPFRKD